MTKPFKDIGNPTWGITFSTLRLGIAWSSFISTNSPPQSSSLIWTNSLHAFATLGTSANERLALILKANYTAVRSYQSRTRISIARSLNYSHVVLKPYLSQMRIVRDNVKYPCMGRNFFVNSPLMTSRVPGWGVVHYRITLIGALPRRNSNLSTSMQH